MPRLKTVQKSEDDPMSFKELCDHDDVCTDISIDHTNYHTTVGKTKRYTAMRGVTSNQVVGILKQHIIINGDLASAKNSILALSGPSAYLKRLTTKSEADRFRSHFDTYLNTYLVDCPWEVGSTNRYQIGCYEACVTARRKIDNKTVIPFLVGATVGLDKSDEETIQKTGFDFSIMTSVKTRQDNAMLGPARLVNHDCSANAMLKPTPDGVCVVSTRDIQTGEEITVFYSGSFFGPENADCLCRTCERLVRNGWSAPSEGPPLIGTTYKDSTRAPGEYMALRSLLKKSPTATRRNRTPGDYDLTEAVFAHTYDRWVMCTNVVCAKHFVQPNGYETRLQCPRCERHSSLYGLTWPNVQVAVLANRARANDDNYAEEGRCGKGRWVKGVMDDGQRMLDEQVTSRFMARDEERKGTRRGLLMGGILKRLKGQDTSDSRVDDGQEVRRSKRHKR